jgi:hypothetical protein
MKFECPIGIARLDRCKARGQKKSPHLKKGNQGAPAVISWTCLTTSGWTVPQLSASKSELSRRSVSSIIFLGGGWKFRAPPGLNKRLDGDIEKKGQCIPASSA